MLKEQKIRDHLKGMKFAMGHLESKHVKASVGWKYCNTYCEALKFVLEGKE
jgi:hypothetical protein